MTERVDTVLITGASGRIGRVLIDGFLARGTNVLAISRSRSGPEEPAVGSGARLVWIQADLTAPDGSAVALLGIQACGTWPDAIVHGARRVEDLQVSGRCPTIAQWTSEFALAVSSAARLVTDIDEKRGDRLRSVVLLSSMYGLVAANPQLYDDPRQGVPLHYGVVRAGVIQLARELAVRLAPRVRVNALSYGGVRGRVDEAFEQRYSRFCPAGRMLDDGDLFGPVWFLASDASSGMTGQNLVIDGGWTAW